MSQELEEGGIHHATGPDCASGRAFPHPFNPQCNPALHQHISAAEKAGDFELPTVDILQRRIVRILRERDHLAAKLANKPTDLDWAALTAERDDLRHQLARTRAAATMIDAIADVTEDDRDSLAAALARAERERDSLARRLNTRYGEIEQITRRYDRLALTTQNLITAVEHRAPKPIIAELAEKARALLGKSLDADTRVVLTDQGMRAVASPPAGSVPRAAQDSCTGELSPPIRDQVNASSSKDADYNIRVSMVHPEREGESPSVSTVNDRGEVTHPAGSQRYMMATHASHSFAGDITRSTPSLAIIHGETDTDWIGEWATGFGYINVRFPKATTRELNDAERALYDCAVIEVGSASYTIHLPATGGIVSAPLDLGQAGCVTEPRTDGEATE